MFDSYLQGPNPPATNVELAPITVNKDSAPSPTNGSPGKLALYKIFCRYLI